MSGPAGRRRWRILLHALDRTGPPVLGRAFARWLRTHHPDEALDVVAFRGGPLEGDLAALGPVTVLLEDQEPWDHRRPDPERVRPLERRLARLPPVDATLLVSVSAGQVLPLLGEGVGPAATWVVEVGDDLHWVDGPTGLRRHTDRWLAGSAASAEELARRFAIEAGVVPEFVEVRTPAPHEVASCRRALGARPDDLLVVGAGIGTHRKGVDLFVEAAAAAVRRAPVPVRFAWIGGEDDPLVPLVRAEVDALGLSQVVLVPSVADVVPWLAAADVFLHPARVDAFPLVCLHAASVGTPVVAFTGVGGVGEMFGPDVVGAPYPDLAGLVGEVCTLVDEAGRRRLGERQRARVMARHTAEAAGPAVRHELVLTADGSAA